MLAPRFTVGDTVEYRFEHALNIVDVSSIIKGPYRDGVWWEYTMENGDMVRDYEIIRLLAPVSN
jgi:hypothetical protein